MSYCSIGEIRENNKKLEPIDEVTGAVIESRIAEAEKRIKVDLSNLFSIAELDAIGSDSPILNLMCIYKTIEITLVNYYGASRKVDEVSDIQYYEKQYNSLLKKTIEGEVKIESSSVTVPKGYPEITMKNGNLKLYPRKGLEEFTPAGADDSYVDDDTLE